MVEMIFNFLLISAPQMREMFMIERDYIDTIITMRTEIEQTRGESFYILKQFDTDYVINLIQDDYEAEITEASKRSIKRRG